ncbi:pyridoxal phosphate-dependent aminotransferase [Halanaeroarchaeum sulfurireducens]|uniref:Aminotransferase n=1 Tax=Halanaeroarchaeum sulfurireducens TaxID=1604004 RepID=A0A0F7PCF6_9EURY|nr:pyridoxal phosphate-dependent aminotransferase [Halanaeroarchaeum sulfurireducens]AKH97048.1 aminotransferase class I and II [Halanaeroarchaeum sulfurireducens]
MNRPPISTTLSDRVRSLEATPMRAMVDLASDQDTDSINLAFGDPDFDTPAHIVEEAMEAASAGGTHYTDNFGIEALRAAIASEYESAGVPVDPDREIAVTAGAIQGLAFATLAVADPGDEIVVPTPAWPSYFTQAGVANATLLTVPLSPEEDFALDGSRVAAAIGDDTAAVILSSPSNPTGQVFDHDEIETVIDAAAANDAWIIADEVYWRLVYGDEFESVAALTDYDRLIVANSASKTYAMTGWRVGWLVGPPTVIESMAQLHQAFSTCASSVSQHALLAALEGPQEPIREMHTAYRDRRDYVLDRIESIPGIEVPEPQGGFYVFPDVRALGDSSLDVARQLVHEAGVVTAPGVGFGDAGEGHLRISFASDMETLATAFDRIEAFAGDVVDADSDVQS